MTDPAPLEPRVPAEVEEALSSSPESSLDRPALVVGLGNPGARYERTLHNVGFLALEAFALRHGAARFQPCGASLVTRLELGDRTVILAKPQSYMNRSGLAIQTLLQAVPGAELLVVHDELDLPYGQLRLKRGGGDGGHRGIRSILDVLGTGAFSRLRVGIGRPAPGVEPAEFVLEPLDDRLHDELLGVARAAAGALSLALEVGVATAMNTVNRRAAPPAAEPVRDGCT